MPEFDRKALKGRGAFHQMGNALCQVYNAAGVCMIVLGDGYGTWGQFEEALRTITGWDITREEMLKTGERIENIRQAFNVREGIKTPWKYPDRMLGKPPKEFGPRKGLTVDPDAMYSEYYGALDWDVKTGKPSKKKLLELGLDDVAKVLYK